MRIELEFEKFLQKYPENEKNKIWEKQSREFKEFWENEINGNIDQIAIDKIVRFLDKHGKGNTSNSESIARTMIPQGSWYSIFNNLRDQPTLYTKLNSILYAGETTDYATKINEIFILNKENKNHLTGPTGSAINTFLAIADPIQNLSIVSLNDRYKVIDLLEIDYGNLKSESIGLQIATTNKLILDYFKNKNLSINARTISVFFYSSPVSDYWKQKIEPSTIINSSLILRENFISILQEEIQYLNSRNKNEWALTYHTNNKIRLHFGHVIVLSTKNDSIWMAIDKEDSNNLNNLNFWKWDTNDYPEYKQYNLFSKNGYFNGTLNEWEQIKRFHFNFIDKITEKKFRLDYRTKRNHDNRIIIELLGQNNISLPLPLYEITNSEIVNEIENEIKLLNFSNISQTEKEVIVKNRIGQNIFRENLFRLHQKCMICSLTNNQILRASHIKPWSESSNAERINSNNGLLLCANHDLLFDRYLITFSDEGNIMTAKVIQDEIDQLAIPNNLKIIMNNEQKIFMEWHRLKFIEKNNL
jgi:5-methylcytosine-specific restriction protein A